MVDSADDGEENVALSRATGSRRQPIRRNAS
jgi:hypothetical protein